MGASGAGKSTLLHLIAGLDSYNSGSISFDSISLGDLSKKELNELLSKRPELRVSSFTLPGIPAKMGMRHRVMLRGRGFV